MIRANYALSEGIERLKALVPEASRADYVGRSLNELVAQGKIKEAARGLARVCA